jgi:hypothetical protein
VNAGPDEAFITLANVDNLPRYVATMTRADETGNQTLHVAADVEGRHEEGNAAFRPDPARHRIEWGGEDGSRYNGWMQIAPDGSGSSVTIHLHVPHTGEDAEINRVLDQTVNNIQRLFTG